MSISFSGLASGLDTSGWIEALVSTRQTKVTTLQTELQEIKTQKSTLSDTRSAVTSLRTAIEKLTDAKFGGTFDLFNQCTATSSNKDIFTATATTSASKQNYDIVVQQLATYTKATSVTSASAVADDETTLSSLGIKEGSFSVYVDGVKTAINIEDNDTVGDLKSQLAAAGIKAEIQTSGALSLTAYTEGQEINIGATTDTTNIISSLGLMKQEDGTYLSSNSLFKANVATKLTSENSGFNSQITAGTFTIGDATFTIDEKTTLSSLISQINNNDDAQARAYWDDATGKLAITSKKEGASYINIEAGTSNFTDVMGFTTTERDADGNITSSKMFTEAQELGQNALFSINGTNMSSTSNTITSDISRIDGVTITLKGTNTEEEATSTLKIEQDASGLIDALKSFVSAYNSTIEKIDEVTATGADLQRESSLTSLKNTLRNFANGSNTSNGGIYKLLSQIGISTASADGNSLSSDTTSLKLDETTLKKALEENLEDVQALLAGDNGILAMMEDTVEQSLKAQIGFFDIKQSTLDKDITKKEDKIKRENNSISLYRSQLEDKFGNMELMIAQMQQNYSSFLM